MVLWLVDYKSLQWSTNIIFPHKTHSETQDLSMVSHWHLAVLQSWTVGCAEPKELVSHWEVLSDSQRHHRAREPRLIISQGVLAKWCQVSPATSGYHHWHWDISPLSLSYKALMQRQREEMSLSWRQAQHWELQTQGCLENLSLQISRGNNSHFLFFKITSLTFFCWHLV